MELPKTSASADKIYLSRRQEDIGIFNSLLTYFDRHSINNVIKVAPTVDLPF